MADEKTTEQAQDPAEQPEMRFPKCGFCGKEPFTPMVIPANDGEQDYRIYCCADCRAVITMGTIRVIPGAPPPQRIVVPPNGFNPTRRNG